MLGALVGAETVLLVLLTVVVIALLRSHAEILRRLGDASDLAVDGAEALIPTAGAASGATAVDVAGVTLHGDAVKLAVGAGKPPTLLAFLTSGCSVCDGFWSALGQGYEVPGGARVIVITHDASHERQARLRELAGPTITVVMSSAAWQGYAVPGAPYFIFFDGGSDRASGEGTAEGWAGLDSLLSDHLAERNLDGAENLPGAPSSRSRRAQEVDDTLRGAGIGPGHPTLYPNSSAAGDAR